MLTKRPFLKLAVTSAAALALSATLLASVGAPEKKSYVKVPDAAKMVTIKKGDISRQVPIFRSFEDVKILREQGLNSGTWVGVQPAEGQRLTVYAVHRDTIDTIGQFQSKA